MTKKNITGFSYIDKMSEEEQTEYFRQHKEKWNSLSIEQKTKMLDKYYTAIRKKRQQNPLLMSVSNTEVMREILNIDLPQALEKAAVEAFDKGHVDSLEWLKDIKNKFRL